MALVTFRGYFLSRAMYDRCLIRRSSRGHCIHPPQGRTSSTSNCSTHVHLLRSYAHPAMVSPSGDLHWHATILTMCLFLLMSHLYFLYPSLITLFLTLPTANSTTSVPFFMLWPLILNQSGIWSSQEMNQFQTSHYPCVFALPEMSRSGWLFPSQSLQSFLGT